MGIQKKTITGIFLLCGIWLMVLLARGSDHATLFSKWTDNASNISSSWIFLHHGISIYGYPITDFSGPAAQKQNYAEKWSLDLPEDVFFQDAHKSDAPDYLAWPYASRPYPPGAMMIYTPFALIAYALDMGFQIPLYLLAFFFLLMAHLAFLRGRSLLLETFDVPSKALQIFINILCLYFYLELVHWALQGQYQICMVWPLIEFLFAVKKRQPTTALWWFSIAFFIHLHTIMYAPLLGLFLLQVLLQDRKLFFSLFSGNNLWKTGPAIIMSLFALHCLYRNLIPYSSGYLSNSNPWFWKNWGNLSTQQLVILGAAFLLVSVLSWLSRNYLGFVTICSMCFIFILASNLGAWYTLAVLPLLFTSFSANKPRLALVGNFMALVLITGTFLANSPFEFYAMKAYWNAPNG